MRSAPRSIRLAYAAIRLGVHDPNDVARTTRLPPRTVRYAVRWLIDRDHVVRRPRLGDARRTILRIAEANA